MRGEKIRATVDEFIKLLNIRTPSAAQDVRLLSGGNQQKIVVAKWLERDCDVLFFDEPTRGIDVGAKTKIYKLLGSLPAHGNATSMIPSELPRSFPLTSRIARGCRDPIPRRLL